MVRHNNVIPHQHFHKKWANRVKTWLQQPIQKKLRRDKRKEKAAKNAPRPASGFLRPVVHCPTQKEAGINKYFAKTVGISVDHRRTNKSAESLAANVQRLKEYKARLIVFPKKEGAFKKGDSSKADIAEATQLKGEIVPKPTPNPAVTFATITEDLTAFKAYASLRAARAEAKLVGIRIKKAKDAKDAPAPKAKDDE